MIPGKNKPKYKALVRLRIDVWKNLKSKTFKRKKWRLLLSIVKRKRQTKTFYNLIDYQTKNLSRFPTYRRYRFQKDLYIRIHIRILYGKFQNFHLRNLALKNKNKSWYNFGQSIEQNLCIFLYRMKLTNTYVEGKIHQKHKRILINGSYIKKTLNKGDVLHFSLDYEKALKRRIYRNFTNFKRIKYGFHQCVDFDLSSIRFLFLDNIKYFKNHPFKLPFERLMRSYTRI
jgi:hypothetical protein